MTNQADDDTRAVVRAGGDQIASYLAHFHRPDSSWDSFGKGDYYLEMLRLHLMENLFAVERELQRRVSVEPTDFGS